MLGLTHGGLASRAKKSTIRVQEELGLTEINFDRSGGGVILYISGCSKMVLFFANTGMETRDDKTYMYLRHLHVRMQTHMFIHTHNSAQSPSINRSLRSNLELSN